MRKLAAALAMLVSVVSFTPAALAETPIRVVVGISQLDFDTPPIVEEGRTLVPLRALAEALGFTVGYEAADRHITLTKGAKVVELWVGFTKAKVGGKDLAIDTAPKIVADRTLVPIRFVSEQLGAVVTWDEKERLIHVARGEEYARGLYETAQQVSMANPFADQKYQGKFQTTMKMSGSDLPPGGVTVEMPMSFDAHLHNGDMLMGMKLTPPGLPGATPITTQLAVKDGKIYSQNPRTGEWFIVGEGDLQMALDGNAAVSMSESVRLEGEAVKGATFSLAGFEEANGVKVARVDVSVAPTALDGMIEQMMGPLAAAGGADLQIAFNHFRMSTWIDVATGRTQRVTYDMGMLMGGSEQGGAVRIEYSVVGDITYSYVSEPIQFPDLSGAVSIDSLD